MSLDNAPSQDQPLEPRSTHELGAQMSEWRRYTPLVLGALALIFGHPSVKSATFGTIMMVAGECLRIYATAFLPFHRSPAPGDVSAESPLIKDGPYAHVRHPMYCGDWLILSGIALYSGSAWLMGLTLVVATLQAYTIAQYEDSLLTDHYGEAHRDYQRTVPAWIPARLLSLADLSWPESFTPALEKERSIIWAILALLTALAFWA